MQPSESLVARVRAEYREIPGLRLTLAEACQLWHIEPPTCEILLQILVREQFLTPTVDGAFVALPPAGARTSLIDALAAAKLLAQPTR